MELVYSQIKFICLNNIIKIDIYGKNYGYFKQDKHLIDKILKPPYINLWEIITTDLPQLILIKYNNIIINLPYSKIYPLTKKISVYKNIYTHTDDG